MAANKDVFKTVKLFLAEYLSDLEGQISDIIEKILNNKLEEMSRIIKSNAIPGYSPVKGKDYFDGRTPVKGKDYFDGRTPVKGVDYFDGKTPVAGIDFQLPKEIDEERVVKSVLSEVSKLDKKRPEETPQQIANKLNMLKEAVDIDVIRGLRAELKYLSEKRGVGGVVSLGGGQGSWKTETLSGDIDGSNTDFTYNGALPATDSERVFLNGQEQDPNDYTVSVSGGVVTIAYSVVPPADLSGTRHYIRFM